MKETNGEPKKLPAIVVMFDADSQQVGLQFRQEDFKNWEFVCAILEMAKSKAEDLKRIAMAQQLQAQQAARMQEQNLLTRLMTPPH